MSTVLTLVVNPSAGKGRAQALLPQVAGTLRDAGVDVRLIAPSPRHPLPLVREATLSDLEAVAALHGRCSVDTLYARYQVPLRMPMTTRLARRLVQPDDGVALVVQVGLDVVGHGVLESGDGGHRVAPDEHRHDQPAHPAAVVGLVVGVVVERGDDRGDGRCRDRADRLLDDELVHATFDEPLQLPAQPRRVERLTAPPPQGRR